MIVERNISNTLANVRLFPKTKYKALMVAGYYYITHRMYADSGMVFVGFNTTGGCRPTDQQTGSLR